MTDQRMLQIMTVFLAVRMTKNGVPNLNSSEFQRQLAYLTANPEFEGLCVTLDEMLEVVHAIARKSLEASMSLQT